MREYKFYVCVYIMKLSESLCILFTGKTCFYIFIYRFIITMKNRTQNKFLRKCQILNRIRTEGTTLFAWGLEFFSEDCIFILYLTCDQKLCIRKWMHSQIFPLNTSTYWTFHQNILDLFIHVIIDIYTHTHMYFHI